ncbi:MAG TPA: nuclear pore complex subunit, partial [Microscillaceae bacterium]|nr:nuclear pore complex subunit [Microscillaceae bacterium]
MDVINLEGTEDTPKIILDRNNGIFEISGRSLPEDSAEFYQPILDWLQEYAKGPNPDTTFIFKLEYFNTASSKLILDILSKLEQVPNTTVL